MSFAPVGDWSVPPCRQCDVGIFVGIYPSML